MPPKFTWSDAWLLFAVALAATRGQVTLKDVIACGDAINHAIFTNAELRRGFAKLIATGHVITSGDVFDVSPEVHDLLARDADKRLGMGTLRKRFDAFLAAAPYPAGHPGGGGSGMAVSRTDRLDGRSSGSGVSQRVPASAA